MSEDTEDRETASKAGGQTSSREDTADGQQSATCPVYFGVRSYLHHFYDKSRTYKDPKLYEYDESDMYLMNGHTNTRRHPYGSTGGRRRCSPVWWKIFMWIGVNLLLLGVVGIFVGYLVPPRTVVVGEDQVAGEWYIDPQAKSYNAVLDACKLVGLVLFCVGGSTLAVALLFPSFIHYCREDADDAYEDSDDLTKVPLRQEEEREKDPVSPMEGSIPATSHLSSVQPASTVHPLLLPQSLPVSYKD